MLHSSLVLAEDFSDDETIWKQVHDTVTAKENQDILDFPARKEGESIGQMTEGEVYSRTGTVGGVWSQILFTDDEGTEQMGYVLTSQIEQEEGQAEGNAGGEEQEAAGMLHKGSGGGVFAEALDAPAAEVYTNPQGISIGTPQAVSSDASLIDLGVFRITHYCDCPICCGPYAGGPTASGTIATTNRTIAVDPTQIPYGTKVVINGQIYVAEDCGGAIKRNCIDIFVADHYYGDELGVYYTNVYILNEG